MKKFVMEMYPNRVILTNKEVCNLLNISYVTCWRERKSGNFPPDVKIGERNIGHFISDVIKYLEGIYEGRKRK